MKKGFFKKGLFLGIIILFVGAGVISPMGQDIGKRSKVPFGKNISKEIFLDEKREDRGLICLCDGLVGYWSFNEGKGTTVNDESGCGNDGTIHEATWTTGRDGNALNFDGMDDYVEIIDNDSLDLTTNISMCAWINASSFQYSGNPRIICKYMHPYSGYSLNIDADDTDHNLLFEFRDINSNWHGAHGVTSLNDEKWHHVVGTFDGITIKVYVDGVLENTVDNASFVIKTNNDSLRFGQTPNVPENEIFKGIIDEVYIYNRSLSEEEIMYLYYLPSLKNSFLFGSVSNTTDYGTYSTINANSMVYIRLFPPSFKILNNDEKIIISNSQSFGFKGNNFIIGRFKSSLILNENK